MSTEIYSCDICDQNVPIELEILKKYNAGQNISVCGNCGFVYVPERRSSDEIAKSWSGDLFQKAYTSKIPYVLARQTYVLDYIMTYFDIENTSICDVGAGEGLFLNLCTLSGKNVSLFGIEPSELNVNLMKENNHDSFCGTIEQYEQSKFFCEKKFDIVTIMWTLENCLDCKKMLKISHSMLKDGGLLVVATGSRILVPYKKALTEYIGHNKADTHCFRFSANSLKNLMRLSGFQIENVNRYSDGEFLLVVGRKSEEVEDKEFLIEKDSPEMVIEFFQRWHKETEWFASKNLVKAIV